MALAWASGFTASPRSGAGVRFLPAIQVSGLRIGFVLVLGICPWDLSLGFVLGICPWDLFSGFVLGICSRDSLGFAGRSSVVTLSSIQGPNDVHLAGVPDLC